MPVLSQTRAADRNKMADRLAEIAAKFGAEVERDDHRLDPHELYLCIKLPGASVSMGLRPAAEGPRGFGLIGHWVCEPGYLFSTEFSRGARPHHKATTFEDDFEVFAALIQSGLRRVSKRTVFAVTPQQEGAAA